MFAAQGLLVFKGDVLGFVYGFVCFSHCQLVHITQGELFTLSPGWKIDIKICLSVLWINPSSFFLLLSLKWNYLEFFPGLSFYFYKMTKCLVLWCMFGRCVLFCFFSFLCDQVWYDCNAVSDGLNQSSLLPHCQSLKDLLCPSVRQIHPLQTGKTPSFPFLECLPWPFAITALWMFC